MYSENHLSLICQIQKLFALIQNRNCYLHGDLILREDPDIIGYNIFILLFVYVIVQKKQIVYRNFKLSRNKNEESEIKDSTLQIASGSHALKYIDMNGRVSIDLYNYFRREFNLESYKLDFVGGNFIGDKMDFVNDGKSCKLTSKHPWITSWKLY